ncbi:type III pantothenate kinase [Candidatus Laterigemmans baculatus]|uniref:type III pantothenate kinase n=1 Tax=Candidatus Laterigemmans baculatus TaxID=2770505 RepID=UPI0013DA12C7|nr:type III pantothenate kinase [Candidatus Laterigemmans baculatus]
MRQRWTILVDVGNSAVKVAVVPTQSSPGGHDSADEFAPASGHASAGGLASVGGHASVGGAAGRPLRFLRHDLRDASWPAALVEQSWKWFGLEPSAESLGEAFTEPRQWIVASVNGPATRALRQCVAREAAGDGWYELTHRDLAMRAELRNPAAVGIDRLLGASAAWRAAGTDAESDRAVISIDAGSAVTIDLVRGGVFLGGAILPGLRLQLSSLTQGTDLLPAVTCEGAKSLEIPGRDTVSAMRTGVMLGLSGGIDRLIDQYSEGCASPPHVYLTGGDAATLEPLLRHAVIRRDDLVLSAIADAARAPEILKNPETLRGEVC